MKKLAFLFIGSYRDFYKNENNFRKMIELLKKNFSITFFGLISKSSYYQPWHNIKKEEINDKNDLFLKNILNENKIQYLITYYDSKKKLQISKKDNIKNNVQLNCEKLIKQSDTFIYQMVLEKRLFEIIKIFEKDNNINFDFIFKTRPDLFYFINNCNSNINYLLKNNYFLYQGDFLYLCQKNIFEKLIEKIELINFTNYKGNKKDLYSTIIELCQEKKIKWNYNDLYTIEHYINPIFLECFDIKSKSINICSLLRNINL